MCLSVCVFGCKTCRLSPAVVGPRHLGEGVRRHGDDSVPRESPRLTCGDTRTPPRLLCLLADVLLALFAVLAQAIARASLHPQPLGLLLPFPFPLGHFGVPHRHPVARLVEGLVLVEDQRDAGGVAAVGPEDGGGGVKLPPRALNEDGAMRRRHGHSAYLVVQEVVLAVRPHLFLRHLLGVQRGRWQVEGRKR